MIRMARRWAALAAVLTFCGAMNGCTCTASRQWGAPSLANAAYSSFGSGTARQGGHDTVGSLPPPPRHGAAGPRTTAFVVPHSHDDVGWTETITQLYDGKVFDIYSSVTAELAKDATRRFVSVEMAFVSRWWHDPNTTDTQRNSFSALVHNGQIELLNAGWVMQDEAVSAFDADIDQMTEGHRFAVETFNYRPRTGWQIDPFGASSTTAVHYQRMGFTGTVADRIPYQVKAALQANRSLDFQWAPTDCGAAGAGITTHVMDEYGYCPPNSPRNAYFWDDFGYWGDSGEPPLNGSSTPVFSTRMLEQVLEKQSWSATPNVLFPWGCDFEHHDEYIMLNGGMTGLMEAFNANSSQSGVVAQFSNTSAYFDAIRAGDPDANAQRHTYTGDFLPYNPSNTSWWTGFYSSRSKLKGVLRRAYATLRAAEIALVLGGGDATASPDLFAAVEALRHANGEAQHHDAVTGTATPPVVQMYEQHLAGGVTNATKVLEACTSAQLSPQFAPLSALGCAVDGQPSLTTSNDALAALQGAAPQPSGPVVPIVLFNSLGWNRSAMVNVTVPRVDVIVLDDLGNAVGSQVIPDGAYSSGAGTALYFEASLPAIGIATYFVGVAQPGDSAAAAVTPLRRSVGCGTSAGPSTLQNAFLRLDVSSQAGCSAGPSNMTITNLKTGVASPLALAVMAYPSEFNATAGQTSDAYQFWPAGEAELLQRGPGDVPSGIGVVSGPLIQQIVLPTGSTDTWTVLTLFNSTRLEVGAHLDVLHHVGTPAKNTEVIARWSTGILNGRAFTTDNNGWTRRKRQYDAFSPDPRVNIAGNYYPAVFSTSIEAVDGSSSLSLLLDRSHGTSSQRTGELEIMLHRRLWQMNAKGQYAPPNVPLNDTDVLNVHCVLLFDSRSNVALQRPPGAFRLGHPPVALYASSIPASLASWTKQYRTKVAPIGGGADLPGSVHLLSLEARPLTEFAPVRSSNQRTPRLVRLAHLFGPHEHAVASSPASVDVASLLMEVTPMSSWNETTLTTLHSLAGGTGPPGEVTLQPLDTLTMVVA